MRRVGQASLAAAAVAGVASRFVAAATVEFGSVWGVSVERAAVTGLLAAAVVLATYGAYRVVGGWLTDRAESKRRRHDLRNVLRLAFGLIGTVGLAGVVTEQWVGVLFSLGVVGFAVTFALQQPLFSLIGWVYIMVNRPYQVGDRVAIEDSKGDVVEVNFLVTTLWEINGDLVSSNQPSGRTITVPNSVVLSAHVTNFTREEFPFVWNEVAVEVAYETDLAFARERMVAVAEDVVGEGMARSVERYRERLAETPVELEVQSQPTVNVSQEGSWVKLRLRYIVHPRRGQRTKNELYERILAEFNEHPDRVKFPVSRNR
ncbi:mechanosensitive ion channel [Halosimplex rubrum]|uniref:Mechanosensitive ion channel n=1 Tax=Halosimplex rubrum TaxID=869889 RepID=A0A7D5TM13_9EURY|nr:mechanosensitive ion channel family protein [Halosimplex rubrum]QLH77952.1 mechanosensitive ion channel [Halosimplex rubrum]